MIRSNLPTLLAERRLSAAKVSKDTRISRTTLSLISTNQAKGIQYDTMNTLCRYLNVRPGDLFVYVPFDVDLEVTFNPSGSEVVFKITDKGRAHEYTMPMYVEIKYHNYLYDDGVSGEVPREAYIEVSPDINAPTYKPEEYEELSRYLNKLPAANISEIKSIIVERVTSDILNSLSEDEYRVFESDVHTLDIGFSFDYRIPEP